MQLFASYITNSFSFCKNFTHETLLNPDLIVYSGTYNAAETFE